MIMDSVNRAREYNDRRLRISGPQRVTPASESASGRSFDQFSRQMKGHDPDEPWKSSPRHPSPPRPRSAHRVSGISEALRGYASIEDDQAEPSLLDIRI